MTRIVTHYRYKRPPRKRKAVALDMPAIPRAKIAAWEDDPMIVRPPCHADRGYRHRGCLSAVHATAHG
jgi:hypothetical protein